MVTRAFIDDRRHIIRRRYRVSCEGNPGLRSAQIRAFWQPLTPQPLHFTPHVFRHTIPRLAKGYETSLKEERESNVEQLAQAREDYKETLNAQRNDFINVMREERVSNEHKLEELTKAVQELTRQVTKVVEQT